MSEVSFPKGFGFSIGMLVEDARRLLGALQDGTIGAPVVEYLSPTFVEDFSTQIALVAKLDLDQSSALGSLGSLVLSQSDALADFIRLSATARRAARLAFAGQDALLRGEFQVGARGSRDLRLLIERGRRLVAACERYTLELAPYGWSPAVTDLLEKAVDGLANVHRDRRDAASGKQGLTAARIAAANRLYRQCLSVQNIARVVYARGGAVADPAAVEARGRFLLGRFPLRPLVAVEPAAQESGEPVTSVTAPVAVVPA